MTDRKHWYNIVEEALRNAYAKQCPGVDTNTLQICDDISKYFDGLPKDQAYNMLITSLPTLYHGTDVRIAEMPKAERTAFLADCEIVCDSLFAFYKDLICNPTLVNKCFENNISLGRSLSQKIAMWKSKLSGANCYQYEQDGIYLTTSIVKAKGYAYSARYFGELGCIAYLMSKCLEHVPHTNNSLAPELLEKMNKIVEFGECDPRPAIYVVEDVLPENLYEAFGRERNAVSLKNVWALEDYFYQKEITLKPNNSMELLILPDYHY